MANKKINDLAAAGAVGDTMQYETDIGGSTPNKVTSAQIKTYIATGTAGGRTLVGGTQSNDELRLDSTSHGIKGSVSITNGTLLRSSTPNYETLVTIDGAIPNKKYVDDAQNIVVTESFTPTLGQTSFPLSQTPGSPTTALLVLNGQVREYGSLPKDFTISGSTLTWNDPGGLTLLTTDLLQIWYDLNFASFNGVWADDGTDVTTNAGSRNVDLQSSGLKDTNVTTAVLLGDGGNTSFNTTNKTIIGAVNETFAAIPSVPVSSVFTRTGAVVAAASDYDASQVDNDSGVSGSFVSNALDTLAAAIPSQFTVYFKPETNSNDGNHRMRSIAASAAFNFEFAIPDDFNALVSLEMIMAPTAGAAGSGKDVDLSSTYGAIGEVTNFHAETDTSSTYDFGTSLTFAAIDVSGVFTNLAAGDICGLEWDNNGVGGATYHYYIKLVYTR